MSEDGDLLALAEQTAREAGELVRHKRDAVSRMAVSATKSTPTDIVTESDTAAEQLIRDRILTARPGDAILGEEGGSTGGTSGVEWLVDPIDGTVNYLYGIPQYAISIAARVDGETAAGAVHNPVSRETWTAIRGRGAYLDGVPVRESGCGQLSQALVATGFGYDSSRRARQADVLRAVLPNIRDVRRAGAASLDLCAVAMGRVDAYYERGLGPWDLAAGALIATEAGVIVSGIRGNPPGPDFVLAAGPALHERLRGLLEPLDPDRD